MLENYVEGFDEKAFVREYMESEEITFSEAMSRLRKKIKLESYYQTKIMKALRKRYTAAFVRKISQGRFSEGGMPDICCIYQGHYFGFEVKRPVVGVPSKLQEKTIRQIREAGGTASFVRWPEEAMQIIDSWEASQRKEERE